MTQIKTRNLVTSPKSKIFQFHPIVTYRRQDQLLVQLPNILLIHSLKTLTKSHVSFQNTVYKNAKTFELEFQEMT